jgi:hypothetical protein
MPLEVDDHMSASATTGGARIFARAAVAALAGLLAAALTMPAGSLPGAAAQETAGSAIKFLNPSDYGEARVASSRDLPGHGYHLVVTVNEVPSEARVIFEIESASLERRRLGAAEQQGAHAFALNWRVPPQEELPSGAYTLRAILFSGNRQVSDDEINVQVRQTRPAVKIDHPGNGDRMGVYQPPGEGARWNTIIDYTFSTATEQVAFFYSLTPPGQEPEWHGCGTARVSSRVGGGAPEPESRRHLCELDEGHDGTQVTGVAAVATDIPFPLARNSITASNPLFGDSSGDAHSVHAYRQLPSSVSFRVQGDEPGTEGPRMYDVDSCTNQILAFARDQVNRPVAGVNIDVHATGPEETDGRTGLRFDVSTGSGGTDANRPPEQNHQDETGAWSCAPRTAVAGVTVVGPGPAGSQGNHRNPNGPDTRHVESTQGTDLNGRFRFRLYSDQPGGTQITAWADLDGDDMYCALEPAAHLSVGWNQVPPSVQGHQPERETCDIPGVEQVQAQQMTRHPRAVTVNFRRAGRRLVIRGRVVVRTGHRPCRRNVPVRVQRRVGNRWRTLRNVGTNPAGRYRVRVAHRAGRYRALAPRIFRGANDEHLCQRAAWQRRYRPR